MKQESRSWIKKYGITALTGGILLVLSAVLLGKDVWTFWTWWLLALLMGLLAMPVTGRLFEGFADKGWMFSKVLAIGITGFLTWFLVAVEILPFTTLTCVGVCIFCALICFGLFHRQTKKGIEVFPTEMCIRDRCMGSPGFLMCVWG